MYVCREGRPATASSTREKVEAAGPNRPSISPDQLLDALAGTLREPPTAGVRGAERACFFHGTTQTYSPPTWTQG
jgi:hypothetical protein